MLGSSQWINELGSTFLFWIDWEVGMRKDFRHLGCAGLTQPTFPSRFFLRFPTPNDYLELSCFYRIGRDLSRENGPLSLFDPSEIGSPWSSFHTPQGAAHFIPYGFATPMK